MIPPTASLVKYDNPVLVSRNTEKKSPRSRPLKSTAQQPDGATSPVPPPPKGGKLPPVSTDINKSQTEEILNAILPPREWTENGALWIQQVSSTPATRMDVINLQEELDMRLQQRQARETGICPVRRELYSQCFDELIRQVTINCAERGLLLLRVRDEIRMTIAAYQTLYESSVAFGMRKALQAEQGKTDMEKKIIDLDEEKHELEKQVNELKAKCDAIEKREAERRAIEEKKHAEEIQFLKRTNQQLKHKSTYIPAMSCSLNSTDDDPVYVPVVANDCGSVVTSIDIVESRYQREAELEQYFQKLQNEFLVKIKLKKEHQEQCVYHDEEIKFHEDAISKHAQSIERHQLLKSEEEEIVRQHEDEEKQIYNERFRNI